MDLGISGKRALVCGASSGLGFACASALAREGAEVILVARNESNLTAAINKINAALPAYRATAVVADVGSAEGQATVAAVGDIDILVNNAGGPPFGHWRTWKKSHWLDAIESNLLSAIALIQALTPGMVERKFGRIVNVTSVAVRMPQPGLELSTVARLGLTGFVASISAELVRSNVTVNNLLPGYFETQRMRDALDARPLATGESKDDVLASIPARRYGSPAEFGEFCAFLCSTQSGYATGQNILLDGGLFRGIV
ncbi:SDR family oxidoreductase [Paraburkholderia azotifigens]|uniref:SDR family oxidoreductase n=1 Tax=Paraburkholderia azotifigens TaxID=2057004 RepID=A0ABU9RDT2_9BURK